MALAMQGRFDEALEAFRRAGDEQSALANLGYAHYARGEYDQAIAQYEKALLAGGKANVEVVRNLEAARRARELARRAPADAPPVAGAPPPVAAPRIDPGALAGEDSAGLTACERRTELTAQSALASCSARFRRSTRARTPLRAGERGVDREHVRQLADPIALDRGRAHHEHPIDLGSRQAREPRLAVGPRRAAHRGRHSSGSNRPR